MSPAARKTFNKTWTAFRKASKDLLVWIWSWVWGNATPINGGDAGHEDGLREAITLLGFLLAWQAALIAYIQTHPNPELMVVAVYVLVSLVPLIGIFSICTIRPPDSDEHVVKHSHRRIIWRLGVAGVFLVIGLASSYVGRMLPGQYETGTYLDTGAKYLGVNLERDAAPVTTSVWRASLSPRAAKHWRIDRVIVFRDKERTERLASLVPDSSKTTPSSAQGYFDAQLSRKYFFRIELEEIGTEVRNFNFSKEDLDFDLIPGVK